LEFHHPGYATPIVTSPIQAINERRQSVSQRGKRFVNEQMGVQ
jgi:hypothetical protein